MKKVTHGLLALVCLLMLACKKDSGNDVPDSQNEPVVRERGTPMGDIARKTIGPEGGVLASVDARIELTVPQGALTTATEISIQPVSNTLPGSPCSSYRLLPEGLTFKTPVTLTFNYKTEDLDSTAAEALFMAYQAADGIWKFIPHTRLDKDNKKLIVKTTHFSDWTPYALFWLHAQRKTLKVGESSIMAVSSNNDFTDFEPDLSEIGIARQRVLNKHENIKNWAATVGTVSGDDEIAIYIAPTRKPADPVAVVSVEIHNFIPPALYDERGGATTKLLLAEEIQITDDTYWTGAHNGNLITGYEGLYNYIIEDSGLWIAGWHAGTKGFSGIIYGLTTPKVGNYPWHNRDSYDDDHHKSYMLYLDTEPELYAPETWWRYCDDDHTEYRASPGGISITKVEEIKGVTYIEGTIRGSLWNGHNDCNPALDSEFLINFRLAPKVMSSGE